MNPTPWQPTREVDVVLRFGPDYGPALKSSVEASASSHLPPEGRAREDLRVLARAVGVATHAYVGASRGVLQGVRLPVNAYDDGVVIALRLHLQVPMTQPIDYSNGQQVAGLLQAIQGLAPGSIVSAEVTFPPGVTEPTAPVLTTLNPQTLPGQKLCAYCRNPMPAYEVQCQSCGGRAES